MTLLAQVPIEVLKTFPQTLWERPIDSEHPCGYVFDVIGFKKILDETTVWFLPSSLTDISLNLSFTVNLTSTRAEITPSPTYLQKTTSMYACNCRWNHGNTTFNDRCKAAFILLNFFDPFLQELVICQRPVSTTFKNTKIASSIQVTIPNDIIGTAKEIPLHQLIRIKCYLSYCQDDHALTLAAGMIETGSKLKLTIS